MNLKALYSVALCTTSQRQSASSSLFQRTLRCFGGKSRWEGQSELDIIIDSSSLTGSLTVCPLPLGNLADLSIRQVNVLRRADVIVCQSTAVVETILAQLKDYSKASISEGQYVRSHQIVEEASNGDGGFSPFHSSILPTPKEMRGLTKELLKKAGKFDALRDDVYEEDEGTFKTFTEVVGDSNADDFIKYIKAAVVLAKKEHSRGLLVKYSHTSSFLADRIVQVIKDGGLHVALVSDQGTPTIGDNFHQLVDNCMKKEVFVEGLPGASSLIVAMSKSGYPADRFDFSGEVSAARSIREATLREMKDSLMTAVMFCDNKLLDNLLLSVEKVFGPRQQLFLQFDMSLPEERHYRGDVRELYECFTDGSRGEATEFNSNGLLTVVIPPFTHHYNKDLIEGGDHEKKARKQYYGEWEKLKQSHMESSSTSKPLLNAPVSTSHRVPVNPIDVAVIIVKSLEGSDDSDIVSLLSEILRIQHSKAAKLLEFARERIQQTPSWEKILDKETIESVKILTKQQKKKQAKNLRIARKALLEGAGLE